MESHHVLQWAHLELDQPIGSGWGLAVDAEVHFENSHYEHPDFEDSFLRRPEVLIYLSWRPTLR